jgi:hypothetical protein
MSAVVQPWPSGFNAVTPARQNRNINRVVYRTDSGLNTIITADNDITEDRRQHEVRLAQESRRREAERVRVQERNALEEARRGRARDRVSKDRCLLHLLVDRCSGMPTPARPAIGHGRGRIMPPDEEIEEELPFPSLQLDDLELDHLVYVDNKPHYDDDELPLNKKQRHA